MDQSRKYGEWTFSPEVQSEIDSFCLQLVNDNKARPTSEHTSAWELLINHENLNKLLKKSQETYVTVDTLNKNDLNEPMEISLDVENVEIIEIPKEKENDRTIKKCVDLLLNVLDSPNTSHNIRDILKDVDNSAMTLVIERVCCELTVESKKLRLCEILAECHETRVILCQSILLPWLSEGKCKCVESIAEILPQCADVACKELILPLLQAEDSPLVSDIYLLKDLTACLSPDHWCILMRYFTQSIATGLKKWHLSVISAGLEKAQSAKSSILEEVILSVVVLMRSHVQEFNKDRDFGNIMISVIACLNSDSSLLLIKQMSDLAQAYAGPLRFKALSMLKGVNALIT